MHQADLLEYYLKTIPGVKNAAVDERTGNATVEFADCYLPRSRGTVYGASRRTATCTDGGIGRV